MFVWRQHVRAVTEQQTLLALHPESVGAQPPPLEEAEELRVEPPSRDSAMNMINTAMCSLHSPHRHPSKSQHRCHYACEAMQL